MRSITAVFVVLFTGCASVNFSTQIEMPGKLTDNNVLREKAQAVPKEEAEKVEVFFGEYPEGFALEDGRVAVREGYGHKVLGQIHADMADQSFFSFGWYDYTEDEQWRSGFCKFNNVMYFATLTLWAFAFPPMWSCFTLPGDNSPEDISERRHNLLLALRKAGAALEADAVLVTAFGRLETVDAASHVNLGTLQMTAARGYAVRLGKGPPVRVSTE